MHGFQNGCTRTDTWKRLNYNIQIKKKNKSENDT